jgi:arabinan endo-1,5-alpha-L-arabinosidase
MHRTLSLSLSISLTATLLLGCAPDIETLLTPSAWEAARLGPHNWTLHDPSRIVELDGWQMMAVTGKENAGGYGCGLELWMLAPEGRRWRPGQCLLSEKPAWVAEELPSNDGAYWAPGFLSPGEIYYSVSSFLESEDSCIGRLVAEGSPPDLTWRDAGEPVVCSFGAGFMDGPAPSAIDPAAFVAADGTPYLVYGGGAIYITELDPITGMQAEGDWWEPGVPTHTHLASPSPDDPEDWIEAPYIHAHDGAYYLFVNWGACCRGVDSTYRIAVGRSDSPTGPFVDASGVDMRDGGGTVVIEGEGRYLGPGHAGISQAVDREVFTFHFYDARRDGASWVEARELTWEAGWPTVGRESVDLHTL